MCSKVNGLSSRVGFRLYILCGSCSVVEKYSAAIVEITLSCEPRTLIASFLILDAKLHNTSTTHHKPISASRIRESLSQTKNSNLHTISLRYNLLKESNVKTLAVSLMVGI